MKELNQIKLGSLLSYLQMGLGIVIGLLYTPIMIRMLGQSEYGLYNTVVSTVSMLSVLSLGFNSSYIRYFSKYKAVNDKESIYKLNGLFIIIFSIIGVIALVCGLYLSFNLNIVFSNGLTSREYDISFVLMILLTINLSVSFPMSVFSNIISANERFVFLKLLGTIKTVVSPLVTLPLLLMGYKSIAMVTVTVFLAFITDALYAYYVLAILKNKFIFHDFEKGLFKGLFVYTAFIAVNMIIDQINVNVDKVLLGRFKGTAMVAIYAVGSQLYSYYVMFSTSVSSVFTPRIHNIINITNNNLEDQKNRLTQLFTKVGRIQFLILGLIASGIVFFGKIFITRIWAGNEYIDAYYVTLLLVIPSSIALIQNLGIEIQRAQNKHKFRSVCYFFMALINLVLSIYLCQLYGTIGSAFGTSVSLIIANGFIMNIYYHKQCNIDIIYFWKSILSLSKGLIIPIIFGIILTNLYTFKSLIVYFIFMIIYALIYVISMWMFGMNKEEKLLIIKPIKKILKRG